MLGEGGGGKRNVKTKQILEISANVQAYGPFTVYSSHRTIQVLFTRIWTLYCKVSAKIQEWLYDT